MHLGYKINLLTAVDSKTAHEISALMRQHVPHLPELSDRYFKKMTADPCTKIFVALNNENHIIGIVTMIIYHKVDGLYKAYIEDLVVNADDRRKGIGEALTKKVLQTARKMKINIVHLTSHRNRVAANLLYQKMGFKIYDTNYYKYDF